MSIWRVLFSIIKRFKDKLKNVAQVWVHLSPRLWGPVISIFFQDQVVYLEVRGERLKHTLTTKDVIKAFCNSTSLCAREQLAAAQRWLICKWSQVSKAFCFHSNQAAMQVRLRNLGTKGDPDLASPQVNSPKWLRLGPRCQWGGPLRKPIVSL